MVLIKEQVDELILIAKQALRPLIVLLLAEKFDLAKQDGLARFLGKPWLSAQVVEDLVRVGG
jgi:hypothetical protein